VEKAGVMVWAFWWGEGYAGGIRRRLADVKPAGERLAGRR